MSIDMAQFHQVFFEESFEGLEIMESGLMDLDLGDADVDQVNTIFRAAHSIKGGAGTFGFMHISDFTHVMETLLDEMRNGERQVTQDAVNVLLQSVDCLREMLEAARDGGEPDEARVAEHKKALDDLMAGGSGVAATEAAPAADGVAPAGEAKTLGWHVVFTPHRNLLQTGNDPVRIFREFASLGELAVTSDIGQLPAFDDVDPEECYLCWDLKLAGEVSRDQVNDIFDWVEDECDLAIIEMVDQTALAVAAEPATAAPTEPAASPADSAPAAKAEAKPAKKAKKSGATSQASSSIRVDIEKIDQLINMVGELVITQSMLSLLGETFEMDQVEKLRDGLDTLERHTRALQESVMQVRMLPISSSFSRFPRLVHDLSAKMGKKIELKMLGETTEVDKTVIEKIGDPLVHLVRNSLDHGIEMPEDRIAAGKPETGTVTLNAFHKGGNIVIEITDDGKGLDRDKLIAKAVEKGLVGESDQLTDQEAFSLIFRAGFSTADQVSDISGRGVGMDVVRRNIQSLGGSIDIMSEKGKGSTISIRLPLTLAILDGQTAAVGDEIYIVPLVSIIESIQVHPDMINLVAGKGETFKLRDEYLPIVRLYEVLGIESARARDLEEGLLVVVEADGRKCGLFIDDLKGQQQVVIKSLEANYQRVEGVSGATILGDGSVALILDVPGLMRLSRELRRTELAEAG